MHCFARHRPTNPHLNAPYIQWGDMHSDHTMQGSTHKCCHLHQLRNWDTSQRRSARRATPTYTTPTKLLFTLLRSAIKLHIWVVLSSFCGRLTDSFPLWCLQTTTMFNAWCDWGCVSQKKNCLDFCNTNVDGQQCGWGTMGWCRCTSIFNGLVMAAVVALGMALALQPKGENECAS